MQLMMMIGAMSWAFLETMKRDFNWNVSYIQVGRQSYLVWMEVRTFWYSHYVLAAAKHTWIAARTLLADTAAVVWLSIRSEQSFSNMRSIIITTSSRHIEPFAPGNPLKHRERDSFDRKPFERRVPNTGRYPHLGY